MSRQIKLRGQVLPIMLAGVAAALILLTGRIHAADETKSTASPEAKLLAAYKVTSIRVVPTEVAFSQSSEYRRILVLGKTGQAHEIDLTRAAKLETASDCVKLGADGYLHPVKDGETHITVSAAGFTADLPVTVRGLALPHAVSFVRDVEPILNKAGCTSGPCHGAAKGKNGFKLSLRGYDPQYDYDRLVHDVSGRRFNRADPARSLMLLKPTAQVPHGGGMRFDPSSEYYQTIYTWLAEGVPYGDPVPAHVTSLEVTPADILMTEPGLSQQIITLAHYADGSTRDVTREASYSSNTPSVAEVSQDGLLSSQRKGEAALLVRYEGSFVTLPATILTNKPGFQWVQLPSYNYIDDAIDHKLRKLKILPSQVSSDTEFLRRVSFDLTGLPPKPAEVDAFLKDRTPQREKRARLIDKMLASPEYVDHWSLKWGDLLESNRKFLGPKGMWRFRDWVRESVAKDKPYNQFVYELLTARGSNYDNPAANYFLVSDLPNTQMETTTQLFLGVRFVCAHCHDHPFEQWTNKQYFELSAFFAQVGVRDGSRNLEKVVYDKSDGEMVFPKTGRVAPPHFPYLQPDHLSTDEGRRELLAEWLTSKNNPYFARAIVNRVWSYFFSRGIIDPVDDIRSSNPPINPELLTALTKDFIDHGFDLKYLIRTIVSSRTYQISSVTNAWNVDDETNFSHALPRRLTAEELMDAISIATGSRAVFKEVPKSFTAEELPDSKVGMGGFLDLFGRPQRESACECERRSEVSLKQALNLINGPAVGDAVADPDGRIAKLILNNAPDHAIISELYVATLDRPPSAEEVHRAQDYIEAGTNRAAKVQDLEWALLNSYAFLFNQ